MRTENKYALVVFALMIVLTGALVFVGLYLLPQMRGISMVMVGTNNELVHVPRVTSTATSADGTEHTVVVDFTLAVDETARRNLNMDSIHASITNVLNTLDHDRINDIGGMDYIKTEVIRELDAHLDLDDLRGVFIRDINRDNNPAIRALDTMNAIALTDQEQQRRSDAQEFFRGLGWRRN